ncbi:LLM class flavin-dependent oxidoreductase [Thermomonospora umbrina]|uniref:Luciferase-like monooxygenase n=1 Tax=Thermomonospora umbrina TaxID=111806 RepID=A0A3D9SYB4_9ACTN|nr:LLM class flavin-dependent oxidoreductase [Thermomonospora umbrina]REF00953.1 luciferase-like monooxygenase [Thermomonospora umbrina]
MSDLRFGCALTPTVDFAAHLELVRVAEEGGLDLVGVQDHPYVPMFVDTMALVAALLSKTERLRIFTCVANLPLRPPAVLAKTAATLDLMSGGRFELGIGPGGYWDGIVGMGGPPRSRAQAREALAEAVQLIRALWNPVGGTVRFDGDHYSVGGAPTGPAPAHPISIWIGAAGPHALRQVGRIADGWVAGLPNHVPYEQRPVANAIIDEAAKKAGRAPGDVERIVPLAGSVTDRPGRIDVSSGSAPVRGTPDQWAELIARMAAETPFTTFIFWPEQETIGQLERFAGEVVPAARALVG